jgi:hypothetical protein
MTVQAVPVRASNEFTIASFSMERFYNDKVDADNLVPTNTRLVYAHIDSDWPRRT